MKCKNEHNFVSDPLRFHRSETRYQHKPEYILANETHNILLDVEIEAEKPDPSKRLHLTLIKRKKNHLDDFAIPLDHRV